MAPVRADVRRLRIRAPQGRGSDRRGGGQPAGGERRADRRGGLDRGGRPAGGAGEPRARVGRAGRGADARLSIRRHAPPRPYVLRGGGGRVARHSHRTRGGPRRAARARGVLRQRHRRTRAGREPRRQLGRRRRGVPLDRRRGERRRLARFGGRCAHARRCLGRRRSPRCGGCRSRRTVDQCATRCRPQDHAGAQGHPARRVYARRTLRGAAAPHPGSLGEGRVAGDLAPRRAGGRAGVRPRVLAHGRRARSRPRLLTAHRRRVRPVAHHLSRAPWRRETVHLRSRDRRPRRHGEHRARAAGHLLEPGGGIYERDPWGSGTRDGGRRPRRRAAG